MSFFVAIIRAKILQLTPEVKFCFISSKKCELVKDKVEQKVHPAYVIVDVIKARGRKLS